MAIGNSAGFLNQHNNSIVLNASGSILNSTGSNRFFVSPIRNVEGNRILFYDSATNEITYGNSNTFTFNGSVIDTTDSSGITFVPLVTFNSDIIVENDITVNRAMTIGTNLTVTGAMTIGTDLTVTGDLVVNGTTVTLNTTTLDVEDLNITVAKGATSAAAANGAGLTVDGASATITYASADDSWNLNKLLKGTSSSFTGNLQVDGNLTFGSDDTDSITSNASFASGTQLKSSKGISNTLSLSAYDVDGTAYTNLITLTASNTPNLTLTSVGLGSINNMSIGATTPSTGKFTTLEVRDTTTTAFDLFFASNSSVALTADRTLTIDVENASRTIALGGNIDLANNLTTQGAVSFSGAFSFTGTLSNNTSVTFPTTGTLSTLAGSESLTNKKLGSLTTNGIVTTSAGDGTLSVTATTGSGSVVLGTSPTIATPDITFKNAAVTGDANYDYDASTTQVASWIANFTATRSLVVSNLTAGRMIRVYVRNTNGTPRLISVTASTTAAGHAAVNLAGNFVGANAAGQVSATGVTLAATSGTAVITVWNAGGNLVGMVN